MLFSRKEVFLSDYFLSSFEGGKGMELSFTFVTIKVLSPVLAHSDNLNIC